jgi:phage tail-like protein
MHDEHTGTAAFRRPVSRYLYDLPVLFHDNEFLGRYLAIFESLWEPLEQRQDHIEMYLDPQTCPATFLHWLAGWFGLALNQRWPEARQRRLLAEATELYRWRGTRYGLTRMIEVCTGLTPTITDQAEAGPGGTPQPFVFHIRLHIPPNSGLDRTFIEDIIQTHKPAHAGYMLEIEP